MGTNSSTCPPLFDYGIQTEQSDWRAHVSPTARAVYVFATKTAQELVASGRYQHRPAWQPGVVHPTAEGVIVPIADIPDLREVHWSIVDWWTWFGGHQFELTTSEKGRHAVNVVRGILQHGKFPMPPLHQHTPRDRITQIVGLDVIAWGDWKIQVKCDWAAGYRRDADGQLIVDRSGCPIGTGNLFLQVRERNPLKLT